MNVRGNVKFSSELTTSMKPHKTFKDPVDQLRCIKSRSTYGPPILNINLLQSTKWESVERVQNNIPGIFQRANEPAKYQGPAIRIYC